LGRRDAELEEHVRHLSEGDQFLGNLHEDRITMLAEGVRVPTHPFSVLPEFQYLLAGRKLEKDLDPYSNKGTEEKWVQAGNLVLTVVPARRFLLPKRED
jgi:hypothetical protein